MRFERIRAVAILAQDTNHSFLEPKLLRRNLPLSVMGFFRSILSRTHGPSLNTILTGIGMAGHLAVFPKLYSGIVTKMMTTDDHEDDAQTTISHYAGRSSQFLHDLQAKQGEARAAQEQWETEQPIRMRQ